MLQSCSRHLVGRAGVSAGFLGKDEETLVISGLVIDEAEPTDTSCFKFLQFNGSHPVSFLCTSEQG